MIERGAKSSTWKSFATIDFIHPRMWDWIAGEKLNDCEEKKKNRINMPDENQMREISEEADVYRSEGNKHYCERNFYDALVKYNKSLCHASVGSEALGLAYANRSAVYFEMKMFQKCLSNIELAKCSGYPESKFYILKSREAKCKDEVKNEVSTLDVAEEFLKLSHDHNAKLPFVAECLELRRSKSCGRFIVTNKDLKVGDIVAIEEPHFKILKSDSRYESCPELNKYQRCAVCLKDNLMDLIPCPSCTSSKKTF